MTVTIKATRGTKKTLIDLGEAPHKHKKALKLALKETGSEVVNKMAKYIFNPPKTGRIYNFRGRKHQASAPGESPANRTGRLAKSGDYKVHSYMRMEVGETAPYAGYLEYGTARILPRPHIIRAVNANHRNMVRAIQEHVKRELSD